MSKEFEAALAKIKGQDSILKDRDERAVESAVISPLLRTLGWDTEDLTKVHLQLPIARERVDFALRSCGKNRVFIEAKKWGRDLTEDNEKQLVDYCVQGKPNLGVLTNGVDWRLFWVNTRRKNPVAGQFLSFSIMSERSEVVESHFRRFLGFESLADDETVGATDSDAEALYKEAISTSKVMEELTTLWNCLADEEGTEIRALVGMLAKQHDIEASDQQIERFLQRNRSLVNKVEARKRQKAPKPVSFTIERENGQSAIARDRKVKRQWSNLIVGICLALRPGQSHLNALQGIV